VLHNIKTPQTVGIAFINIISLVRYSSFFGCFKLAWLSWCHIGLYLVNFLSSVGSNSVKVNVITSRN